MIKENYYIKYQACNLCDSLHRNINDNFKSVSFEVLENGDVQTKIVLKKMTQVEKDFIEEISVEFSSKQQEDCVLKPIVEVGTNIPPLKNIVYQQN
ncbi:MAG: hypothetical protein AAGC64_13960 [Bacteroidota bacterium]